MHQLEIAERIGCSVAVNKNILVHSLEMKENFYRIIGGGIDNLLV